jgi:hypothetical protein
MQVDAQLRHALSLPAVETTVADHMLDKLHKALVG